MSKYPLTLRFKARPKQMSDDVLREADALAWGDVFAERDELKSKLVDAEAQTKQDIAHIAAMCNEIVSLRSKLEDTEAALKRRESDVQVYKDEVARLIGERRPDTNVTCAHLPAPRQEDGSIYCTKCRAVVEARWVTQTEKVSTNEVSTPDSIPNCAQTGTVSPIGNNPEEHARGCHFDGEAWTCTPACPVKRAQEECDHMSLEDIRLEAGRGQCLRCGHRFDSGEVDNG